MPSTQDRFRSNQVIFFQCMGYLQAQIRLGTRQFVKGFLQGSWAVIHTREDMGGNINELSPDMSGNFFDRINTINKIFFIS